MGGGGAMHIAAQYPTVFAAGISAIGWIDTTAWATELGDCQPGVRWKTSTGPLCTEMLDQVYLTQRATTDLPPLMLTWNNDDATISPARYPALIAALETAHQGYLAQWRPGNHDAFSIAGEPHFRYALNAPYVVFTGGADPASASGTRQTDRSWRDLTESATQLTVTVAGTGTSSITIRRRQSFKPAPGTAVNWTAGTSSGSVVVGSDGNITVPAVSLIPAGTLIRLTTGGA